MPERIEQIIRAVEKATARLRLILWAGVLVALVGGVIAATLYDDSRQQADKLERQADKLERIARSNRQAIRVSCLLLSEQLIQSGGAPAPKGYKFSDVSKASRRLQERFIKIIVRSATPADLRYIAKQTAVIDKAGGPLVAPDCDDVAMHPERVERQLKASQAR